MPAHQPQSARSIAATVLNRCDPKRNYVNSILNPLLQHTEQKQRATDLVCGTIRNRTAIDAVITTFSGRQPKRIPDAPLNIIRIAVYELAYCPHTPEYSIVNEAVENAKAPAGGKQPGFVNAVLRQICRHIANRRTPPAQAQTTSTLPQTPTTGCEFDTPFLPDPEQSPADYFTAAFSLPKWLATDWLKQFGQEQTGQICFASNRKPSIYINPNTLKITAEKLAEKLCAEGIDAEIVPEEELIRIKSPKAVTELPGFAEGLFTIQDTAAAKVVKVLAPGPGWSILDLCAAPGTKTVQLAQAANNSAKIIATDIDPERLKLVGENCERLGITTVTLLEYEEAVQKAPFDAVLLDVPCSNTGVLAKRIEARYRLTEKAIAQLAESQKKLLTKASEMIKPGGKICYSTCSIQSRENDQLIKKFLQDSAVFELKSESLTLPLAEGFDHDGGYIAILHKSSNAG